MAKERVIGYPGGLYRSFERKGGTAPTATHYCPGCGHGILHKLIGEALADLGVQDRSVMISPVGCAVFGYYYFDCGNFQAAHGRAPAVGTGIARMAPDAVVISYQGDGDLCSIGLGETLHAANRGERLAVFFVNNAVYGMTGGQMAPTTLLGQKTTTSPEGRSADSGFPLHACEMVNLLTAPVYVERCSLADAGRVRTARRAVRKALQIQKEARGFAFVEFLSPCPTNMGGRQEDVVRFVRERLEVEFPLGCLRDHAATAEPLPVPERSFEKTIVDAAFADYESAGPDPAPDPDYDPCQIRIAGFGGQGVLSLGMMVTRAAREARRFVTWIPSYGPEQRGGTANCSVVVAGGPIGSPVFAEADVLVALNQPSLHRFGSRVSATGTVFYEASVGVWEAPAGVQAWAVPAREMATAAGTARAANSAMLGVLAAAGVGDLSAAACRSALCETFKAKSKLIPPNLEVFAAAMAWARQNGIAAAAVPSPNVA